MKLHRLCDVVPDSSGIVCRQSTWRSIASAVGLSLVLIIPSTFLWWANTHLVWATILTAIAVAIIPSMIGDVRRTLRPTNWLAWIRFDSLWINARTYQDQSPTDQLCVVQLEYREIAEVGQHTDRYNTPARNSQHNSVQHKLTSLDIRLNPVDTSQLEAMLTAVRHRPQPVRTYLGFIKSTSQPTNFPVSLAEPDLIRIAWRGGTGFLAAPSLSRVLAELTPWVKVGEPTRRDEQDWRELSDAEVSDLVLRLVKAGDRMSANDLLMRRRGLNVTQATEFVAGLERPVD
jgi:hypothetical protein